MSAWTDWIGGYLTWLRAGNASAGTVRLRGHYLARLARRFPAGPLSVSTVDLLNFQATPGWAAETRKSARSSVRGLFGWAVEFGLLERDPSARLPRVSVPAGVPRPAPRAVFAAALLVAGEREQLMLMLAGYQGLRRGEIAALHSDHLVGDELLVRGKGGKVRRVPLLDSVAVALSACPPGWVFPGNVDGHVSADWVGRLLHRALGPGWSAHTLRHRFACAAYAGGRDLLAVQQLLGHSKPETTQRYTQVPAGALRAAVLAAAA